MIAIVAIVAIVLMGILVNVLAFRQIDFGHYMTATKLLLHGDDPYKEVEFFFPPWSIVLLGPFTLLPLKPAAGAWLILAIFSQVVSGAMVMQWGGRSAPRLLRIVILVLPPLLPAALFSYVTGQISPLIGFVALIASWISSRTSVHPLVLALAVGAATLKPHIVAIPLLLCLLELVRGRKWNYLAWIGIVFAGFVGVAYAVWPFWIQSLSDAWLGGSYRGGPGLVAPGYRGLLELGVPYWLLIPTLAYTLHAWVKDHLSARVIALGFTTGLLLAPYTRSYDQVILTFPICISLLAIADGRRLPAALILVSALALPLTSAWMLAPVISMLGLLFLHPVAADGRA